MDYGEDDFNSDGFDDFKDDAANGWSHGPGTRVQPGNGSSYKNFGKRGASAAFGGGPSASAGRSMHTSSSSRGSRSNNNDRAVPDDGDGWANPASAFGASSFAVVPNALVPIRDLGPQSRSVMIAGKIVYVDSMRSFVSQKAMQTRHLLKFLIKDDTGTVMCLWWLDALTHPQLDCIRIGQRIQVVNPEVKAASTYGSGSGDANAPKQRRAVDGTCAFEAHISTRNLSIIEMYKGTSLFRVPLIDYGFVPLNFLKDNGQYSPSPPLLVCVRQIGQITQISRKDGSQSQKCEIVVMDKTMPAFPLVIWGDACDSSHLWVPFQSVLLLQDVSLSSFRGQMQASMTFGTVVDVDPDLPAAKQLYEFAQNNRARLSQQDPLAQLAIVRGGGFNLSDAIHGAKPSTLADAVAEFQRNPSTPFVASIQGIVTQSNLADDDTSKLFKTTCSQCKERCEGTAAKCWCGQASQTQLSLQLAIADYTGSISSTTIFPSIAYTLLGVGAHEVQQLALDFSRRRRLHSMLILAGFQVLIRVHKDEFATNKSTSNNSAMARIDVVAMSPL